MLEGRAWEQVGRVAGHRTRGAGSHEQSADHRAAPVVAEYTAAVNAFDNDRIVATCWSAPWR
jgi:hypothetical protein